MKNISFRFLFPLLGLILITLLLNHKIMDLPALGPLLNPMTGVLQNAGMEHRDQTRTGTGQEATITFDERGIPHVFAGSDASLYYAQGYVTAADRLWQMDFMSYVSAGRLSEIFGKAYLQYDRMQRRTGVYAAARKTLAFMEEDPTTRAVLDSYTAGVNAWISSLSKADMPFEYKLINYRPEPWTNLKSVLVMKYVGANLTGYEEDVSATYLHMALGAEDFSSLYPELAMESTDEGYTLHYLYDSLPHADYIDYGFLGSSTLVPKNPYNPRLGSNAWAVAPQKSGTGNALLANDPHLNLTLPAIWYELQLQAPELNVYGYSIPGTPGIVIGYNDHISWGVTNGATDVRDWYKLRLTEDYKYYEMDGKWLPTDTTLETIGIKDEEAYVDTIYHTEHGPVTVDRTIEQPAGLRDYALRWSLHEASNEFLALYHLNRAADYTAFTEAIRHFRFPVQNFLYADTQGNIARHHQGSITQKDWRGQGKYILDGTRASHLSTAHLAVQDLPAEYNPDRGYVYSANNNPFSDSASYYVNGYYAELRASRVNALLRDRATVDVDYMKAMQLDNTNRLAELALPTLLSIVGDAKSSLGDWDYTVTPEASEALLFEQWWEQIEILTWDEVRAFPQMQRYPDDILLLRLIQEEPAHKWFDMAGTDQIESAREVLSLAWQKVKEQQASPWGESHHSHMTHLTNIKALGRDSLTTSGHPEALNAFSDNWGPSLRMVVEMSNPPQAWGIFAGGPSGNPASPGYDAYVEDWLQGQYYPLKRFRNQEEALQNTTITWTIKP